jgi:hypothetical protein
MTKKNRRPQNRQNFNVLWFQWKLISRVTLKWGIDENCIQGHVYDGTVSKMAANKIGKLLMVSDVNEHWYLGVFWSEELVGNDEICIQGHFYEATIFKMATNKIVKLSMVSDFNENWYLGVFWSEELVGNDETCIHMSEFWYLGVVWGLLCLHPNTIKPRYYITTTVVGRCIVILRFFFTILFILILILPHIFVRSIFRRCLDQTLWNLVGISYAMWSCAFKGWFSQNYCRCHGNGQNATKLKNTKVIIAGYSPNRNWWNMIGTTSTSSVMR